MQTIKNGKYHAYQKVYKPNFFLQYATLFLEIQVRPLFPPRFKNKISNITQPLNPIQDRQEGGEGRKAPPTSFSPVTFTNLGITLQNFLTFCFNPFATLV